MNPTSFFRQLYSLDTLDTRLTTSSKTPAAIANEDSLKTTNNDGISQEKSKGTTTTLPAGASPSKWNTIEFYFYALAFIFCVPNMYKAAWDVSQPSSPHLKEYEGLLSDGWLFGRKVDNSDGQYASFRDNIPYLGVLVIVHPLLRRLYERFSSSASPSYSPGADGGGKPIASSSSSSATSASAPPSQAAAQARFHSRVSFDFFSALGFVAALHGFSAFKVLLILYLNYCIAMRLPRDMVPVTTWAFNITTLFANELAQGYRFTLLFSPFGNAFPATVGWAKFLDSWGGLNSRWEVLFNFTVLRMISFNLDYYWSTSRERAGSPVEKKQLSPSLLSPRDRVDTPAPASTFTSFRTYMAYTLYPPLYLAGPIVTFNDYISQSTYRAPSITSRRTFLYAVRFLLTLFCMEFLLHTIYVVAISNSNPNWSTYTPFQLSMLAYFNLHIIWLKLLIPWRFFRTWSLLDGIDPAENVVRCMSDNYSTLAFWRAWHRSFNMWIVRYIYVPLGGSGRGTSKVRAIANTLAVFTFVALWHDINLRLLAWSWLVVLFVLPEIVAGLLFPRAKWAKRPTAYRVLCGIGAVFNILMMMSANLVGFAVGLDGLKGLVNGMTGSAAGWAYLLGACGTLFVGAQVMFEHREEEKRKGIMLRY